MSVGIESVESVTLEEPRAASRDGRERLLNGARQLLAEKGYAGMELRDVAERGEAPRGSIYHHFPAASAARARGGRAGGHAIRALIERSLEERGPRRR
jgi:AcrR family transcriptional regulator